MAKLRGKGIQMKRLMALFCATMACACCIGLAACGGSSSSGAASSSASASSASASSASASSAADPAKTIVGKWVYAGANVADVTVIGDMAALAGESLNMDFTFNEDGTGALAFNNESVNFKWQLKDSNIVSVDVSANAEEAQEAPGGLLDSSTGTFDLTLEDGILSLAGTENELNMKVYFSKDGTIPGVDSIDVAAAKPITSESALIGNWTLTGMQMLGATMYGSGEALGTLTGGQDMSMSITAGGTGSLGGTELTWSVTPEGATVTESGQTLSVKELQGDLLVDMSSVLGSDIYLMYSNLG